MISSPAYTYSTFRIRYRYSGNRLRMFDFPIISKSIVSGNRVMEWYPAPPTLQIKIRRVISPTSDFDKVHQLPFAKHEYLKIFVKIIYSHDVNKFCKNYKNNIYKNLAKNYLTTRDSKLRLQWPLQKIYYFNLAGTNNLLLKAFIYCCRCWFFCCCCWCWCGCCLSTPANFIFVLLW